MQQTSHLETTLQTDLLQADLSNEDVAILYDIVTHSNRFPDSDQFTFRALFSAYEIVLTERGIDPDHDHVYFRFLLRLGGVPGHGSVYEKFLSLLDELGIQLEIDGDERANNGEGALGIERLDLSENVPRLLSVLDDGPSQLAPKRRASDSVYDLTTQGVVATLRSGKTLPTAEGESRPRSAHGHTDFGLQRLQTDAEAKARSRKESLQREIDALRNAREAKKAAQSSKQPLESMEAEPLLPANRQHLSRLYDAFVEDRAERLIGSLFDRWRVKLHVHDHKYRRLRHVAEKIDRQVLLRQAWDRLRSKSIQTVNPKTLGQYELEEQRANDARDRFLLTKAFTHWAKLTFDERHRTGEARNLVIKGRLFTAWRDLTATNIENIRLFTLKRFFQRWRQRRASNLELEYEAIVHYEDALRQRIYQEWFWSFCSGRAPIWRDGKLIVRYARQWLETCRALKDRTVRAEKHYTNALTKRLFSEWRRKLSAFANAETDAKRRYETRLQKGLYEEVKAEALLAPAARAVTAMIERRAARTTMATWCQKLADSRRAGALAEQSFKQKALSKLREGHAFHLVQCKVNERVANDALYKWILAERGALLQRHLERKRMGYVLDFFKFRVNEYNDQLDALRQRAVERSKLRLKRMMLSAWRTRLATTRAQEQEAANHELLHGGLNAFRLLIAQHDHNMKLDEWATLSNYYLTCKKMLRRWREATFERQREKRRQAYLAVKRMLKVNLATRMVKSWHEQTTRLEEMDAQAEQLYEAHLEKLSAQIFQRWLATSRTQCADIERAENKDNGRLLSTCLETLKVQHKAISDADAESDRRLSAKIVHQSSTILRKWSMKSLAFQGIEQQSALLRRRNEKAHFRAIFAHWRYKVSERVQENQEHGQYQVGTGAGLLLSSSIGSTGSSSAGGNQPSMGFSASTLQDREDWIPSSSRGPSTVSTVGTTITAPSTVNAPTTFQQAGYLSTPSRRAARARAAVKLSTQTAAASRDLIATLNQGQSPAATGPLPSILPPSRPSSIPLPVPASRIKPFLLSRDFRNAGHEEGYERAEGLPHAEFGQSFGPALPLTTPALQDQTQRRDARVRQETPAMFEERAQSTTPKGSPLPQRTIFNFHEYNTPSPALLPAALPIPSLTAALSNGASTGSGDQRVFHEDEGAPNTTDPPVSTWTARNQSQSQSQTRTPLFARSRRTLELRKKLFAPQALSSPASAQPLPAPVPAFSQSLSLPVPGSETDQFFPGENCNKKRDGPLGALGGVGGDWPQSHPDSPGFAELDDRPDGAVDVEDLESDPDFV